MNLRLHPSLVHSNGFMPDKKYQNCHVLNLVLEFVFEIISKIKTFPAQKLPL